MNTELIQYDKDINLLKITSPNNMPLKVEFSGDIELQINGEFNLLTIDNNICLDSLNSKIYLNSQRCKSIRDKNIDEFPEIKKLKTDYLSEIESVIPLLLDRIYDLETRIIELEKKEIPVIELNLNDEDS